MTRLIKEEKGVVSIAMAIIIPVIVLGVICVYAILDKPQQENAAHKIVYASSEAYLSRHNAYLFEQLGLLANLDSNGLQSIIEHYLKRNKLITDREAVTLSIGYEHLSNPDVFNEAVNEAATVLVGNAMVTYGVNLLDQFTFAEKIRALNQTIHIYEEKMSEQFDKIGISAFLRTIEACNDVQSGRRALDALESQLNAQNNAFFKVYEDLLSVVKPLKETIVKPQQTMKAFVESKEAEWGEMAASFRNDQSDYLHLADSIKSKYELIESDEVSLKLLMAEIESEKLKKPLNQDKIEQLNTRHAEVEDAISGSNKEIALIVSDMLGAVEEDPPSMIEGLKHLILEAAYLFSGIEIGSGSLNLDDALKHSVNDFFNTNLDTVTKVTLNEYYLAIFSSYDINCPRAFDPQNRQNILRGIKGEAEYLISGIAAEKQSVSLVRLKIVAIRSAANLVTLLCDKDKLASLSTATVAIPQPWRSLAYSAAIIAWSGVESYSDINRLMKGEGLYFLKTQAQWAIDFDGLFDGSWKDKISVKPAIDLKLSAESKKSITEKQTVTDPNMYYLDYLRLLLLIQDEDMTLLRAMDLIEAELMETSEGTKSLVDFSRGHVIDLTWNVQGIFGLVSESESRIHMRNGFK